MASAPESLCPTCGQANRVGARFCDSCGRALASSCAQCGTELRAGARFCDACGAPIGTAAAATAPPRPDRPGRDPRTYTPKHLADRILTSRTAIEGERKQVTVLFADVTGSMELAEQVDPEEWHRILDRFFEILTEGVHRYEGTINQYTGDGVMALFGAPISHEDHAHRACYAALHLVEELRRFAQELKRERGLTFATRIGLNSGEVVVGKIGDDLRMDYTAQGRVVGIAARLQTLADPGEVYVSDTTAALVSGFFELASLGEFRLKGVSQPMRVCSLEGVGRMRTRLDVSRARGLSRFVGRSDEMASLESALARAAEGQGRVVGVVAEAGTGKSRLCAELVERCRSRGVAVHEGRGVAHGRLLPFLPLLELLRGVFGLTEQDGEREARQKIAGTLMLIDPRFDEALPLVFDFLGVPDPARPAPLFDPADRQRQLFGIIARLLKALGERESHVILLEDLHWFDEGTGRFLDTLLDAIAGTKTLVLLNFRPEFLADWMKKTVYQQLPLLPLGPEAMRELLDDLLGRDPSLSGFPELVQDHTGGNPFFVEEVVQSLIEGGSLQGGRGAYRLVGPVTELRVPPTIHALLAARIDRLPERERRLLQTAAVMGKRFPQSILKRVAELPETELEDAIRTLRGRDLIFEEVLFPEVEYAFKHPLTQEVAYGSQLAERRKRAHAAVAELVEKESAAKLDERTAALLAHHWKAAGESLRAARWHGLAAEWSEGHAPASAVDHWRAVRSLAAEAPESPEAMRLRLAAAIGLVRAADYDLAARPEFESAFAEGHRLALETGDTDARVRILLAYSALVLSDRDFDRSAELLAEAEAVVAGIDDPELKFVVRGHAGFTAVMRGDQRAALERYDEAFALLGERKPKDSFVLRRYLGAGTNRAMIVAESGRLADGARDIDRIRAMALEAHDLTYVCIGDLCRSRLAMYRGAPAQALAHAASGLDAAERLDAPGFRATARLSIGLAHLLERNWDEAIAAIRDAKRIATPEMIGPNQFLMVLARLAEACLGKGNFERALELSAEAIQRSEGARRLGAVEAHLSRARVLTAISPERDAAEIVRLLDRATELARGCGGTIYEPSILETRAALARASGQAAEAERELREALRLYADFGATGHAERLARELPAEPENAVA